MTTVFGLGVQTEGGWMLEALYPTEALAIENCREEEFLLEIEVGSRLPDKCEDAIKLYWPNAETWETSTLYKLREEQQ